MVDRPDLEPSLRASLRGWLVGPAVSAEEAAAFAEYTRELTIRLWPGLGLVLGVATLAWWPTDRLVYSESAVILDAFADFRLRIFVLDVGFALVLPRLALARRHAHTAAWLTGLSNFLLAGWFLAEAGEGAAADDAPGRGPAEPAATADGRVLASRAKRLFRPVTERRFLGIGKRPTRSRRASRAPKAGARCQRRS